MCRRRRHISPFELIVAQNYAPVPVMKGETAREVAKTWCLKRDIPNKNVT